MNKDFSIREAIRTGWKLFKANAVFLIALFVAMAMVQGILYLRPPSAILAALMTLVSVIVSAIISLGFTRIMLDVVDGVPLAPERFFKPMRSFFSYILACLIGGIAVVFGLILLIVPGIIIALAISFFKFLIVDRQLGPIASLKESWAITKGVRLTLLGFYIVLGLLNLAGLLALGIGLLVTMPVSSIACAYVYRKLAGGVPTVPLVRTTLSPTLPTTPTS